MRIISTRECKEWLQTKLGVQFPKQTLSEKYPHSVSYKLPIDTHAKTGLARVIAHSIDLRMQGLLWIRGWGIYPSAENPELFYSYRRSIGENRFLIDAPAHVVDDPDVIHLERLLDLVLPSERGLNDCG
ncbi:MAG: hypothetical protein EXQ56_11615 [Acidobacteria bacterium]|nr:hypothetical protein [Acidobacteriota bacterium]